MAAASAAFLLCSCSPSGRVTQSTPPQGSENQPADTPVTVLASGRIVPESVTAETFLVEGSASGPIDGDIQVENHSIIFTPAAPFLPGETITVTVTHDITLRAGLPLKTYRFSFTVAQNQDALALLRTSPVRGHAGAPLPLRIDAFFSARPLPFTVTSRSMTVTGARTGRIPGTVRVDAVDPACLTFQPDVQLPAGEDLTCVFTTRIAGEDGPFQGHAFTFTTRGAPWSAECAVVEIATPAVAPPLALHLPHDNAYAPALLIPAPDGLELWLPGPEPVPAGVFEDTRDIRSMALFSDGNARLVLALRADGMLITLRDDGRDILSGDRFFFPHVQGIAVHDIDLDGEPELLTLADTEITAWRRTGTGLWEEKQVIALPGAGGQVELADLNGDGLPEILRPAPAADAINVARAVRAGRYEAAEPIPVPASRFLAADLTGDGLPEIVAAGDGRLAIVPNEGGAPGMPIFLATGLSEILDCAAHDVDGDGLRDLLLLGDGVLQVRFNDGGFVFNRTWDIEVPPDAHMLLVCDLNGDGVPDAAVCGESVLLIMPEPGQGQQDFSIALAQTEARPGQRVALDVSLSNPEPVQGFTLAVQFPAEHFAVDAFLPAGLAADADLVIPRIDQAGGEAVLAVILAVAPPFTVTEIPPGCMQPIASLGVVVAPDAPDGLYAFACGEAPLGGQMTGLVVAASTVYPRAIDGAITVRADAPPVFIRGDVDASGQVDHDDWTLLLDYLLNRGPAPACMEAADTNGDGRVSLDDAFYLLAYLNGTGPPPPPPFPTAGTATP